jgi:two-component system, OmpR family, phosphate regulon sensor histidine kinase PhoR
MIDSPLAWLAAALAGLGLAALARQQSRRRAAALHRLEGILRELAAGRPPGSVLFSDAPWAPLTPHLDHLATALDALRAQASAGDTRLETILASMPDGVMVADAQHLVRTVNPAFLALFKATHDPCGQSVLHTLREAAFDALVTAALASGEARSGEVELSGAKPRRSIATHVTPLRESHGGAGVVAIFRETTRLRQLEDVRREFVANVSHELRTPLSIFHGYVEMLTDAPDMPRAEQAEVFAVLRRNSRRLNAILEDLLVLARLESRHEAVVCEAIDVGAFLRDTGQDWERTAREKQLHIAWEIAPDLPVLHANRHRLEQVLTNLLDNAVKYTDAGGRIAVRACAAAGHLELRISDSGRGIPPADLPHIFERFYRADKARSREQGGTGLGLSIVKHIVQAHGGSVAAESTYARGTTIIVRLPLAGPEHTREAVQGTT